MKKGSAVVEVTLEVSLPDRWGSDCEIKQLFKQAEDGAISKVGKLIQSEPTIRIKSKPKVTAVLVEEIN